MSATPCWRWALGAGPNARFEWVLAGLCDFCFLVGGGGAGCAMPAGAQQKGQATVLWVCPGKTAKMANTNQT